MRSLSGQTVGVNQDRLQKVLAAELERRRDEVLAVDARLAPSMDRLAGFVMQGGKRLRPEFLWCGWSAGGGPEQGGGSDAAVTVGAAVEFIQACALIHDDIIDRSERRRGGPSMHRAVAKAHADDGMAGDSEHFGVSAALLLGDMALAWADDLFTAGADSLDAVERSLPIWRSMRTEVLSGQLLDLLVTASTSSDPLLQASDAMQVNRFKTAAYTVKRPLQLGAVLAGAKPDVIAALRRYGSDIGIAFQLRDDLLGVFGDPAVTGKPAGDDLLEGKRTLLLALARTELARGPLLAELDSGIGSPEADPGRLAAIIAGTGAVQQIEDRITTLVESGLAAISGIGGGARDRLTALAHAATARRS